jgi:hypothetical protein
MKNDYYIYAYLDPRKPGKFEYSEFCSLYEPFYIGKGNGRRCNYHLNESKNKNSKLKNRFNINKIKSILKIGLEPFIEKIYTNLSEDKSYSKEIELISEIGRKDLKIGPLTNLTFGGDGTSGYVFTDEDKIKMSNAQKTGNHHLKLNGHSEESKKKISKSKLGDKNPMYGKKNHNSGMSLEERYGKQKADEIRKKLSKSHIGKEFSEETKNKMSLKRKGKSLFGNFKGQPKTFIFTNPNKKEYTVIGSFDLFCKENNLPIHTFKRIVQNKRNNKYWNNWTVIKINT